MSYICEGGVDYDSSELINRNHNHAEEGMMGVIPENMRDGSFIVRGKGNPDSLNSSSHGAGRVLSRKKAKETLSLDIFEEGMKGIKAKVGNSTLDESAEAYKDIFDVMNKQKDLVEVVHHVKPIINIKA